LDSLGANLTVFELEPEADTHYRLLSRIVDPAARLEAFKAYGRPSLSSGISARIKQQLDELSKRNRYDLIHIGRSYMLPALPPGTGQAVTVDLDEDDQRSLASQALQMRRHGDAVRARWLDQEGRACDDLIAGAAQQWKRSFAASAPECSSLLRRHPDLAVELVPNAVEIPRRLPRIDDGRTLLFVGSLGYQPNVDGLLWFARSIMPALEARAGRIQLLVAGANPSKTVRALGRRGNIRVLGWVDDLGEVYRRATLAIAPLPAGGGTRIKVLEAAAFGVPSIVDRRSAEPLFEYRRPWGWVCSSAADFIGACVEALKSPGERDRRGRLGYAAVANRYSRSAQVARLERILRDCCN
jgi:glycosyltransferase involved in cell wall biosynthesis